MGVLCLVPVSSITSTHLATERERTLCTKRLGCDWSSNENVITMQERGIKGFSIRTTATEGRFADGSEFEIRVIFYEFAELLATPVRISRFRGDGGRAA